VLKRSNALAEPLTAHELDILGLLVGGTLNAQSARHLIVEPSTLKTHLIDIYAKLGVHSRSRAVARARTLKILD